jgi:rSAM/selenodomain-associated transferase 2
MLSVIIPVLNPDDRLALVLASIEAELGGLASEVIVVSAGMTDEIRVICQSKAAKIVDAKPGRGHQLGEGAKLAASSWLLFLHADSVLTKGCGSLAAAFLMDPVNEDRAAWFQLSFDDQGAGPNRVAEWANWRSKTLGLPYGDQGLLISKSLYILTGGYSDLPLMEDVDLVRRIGRTRLVGLQGQVETSAERYQRGGYWRRPARNLFCLFLFYCRAPIGLIDRIYRGRS